MTINEARAILNKNVKIAADNKLSVVTFFVKDIMTNEIAHMSIFSDSRYEAHAWAINKAESLKRFVVPYASYMGHELFDSSNTLEFDK